MAPRSSPRSVPPVRTARFHPVDYVVRSMSNPQVERLIARERERAGVGRIRAETGTRQVYRALRENRWVAMLADHDRLIDVVGNVGQHTPDGLQPAPGGTDADQLVGHLTFL